MVSVRRLSPEGDGHETVTLGSKEEWIGGVPHQLGYGTSASEDAGLDGVDCEIPYRLGRKTKHPL